MNESVSLRLESVERSFQQGTGRLEILRGVSLSLAAGEITALVGPSGTGKSTLLLIAGLLEQPTSGKVMLDGKDCTAMDDSARTVMRQTGVGFVYQFHHLLP